jgi:DNA topoisomerase VI B subunit
MPPKDKDVAAGDKRHRDLQTKTPAQFFAENRHFAGFENPGKAIFTSIRELVENALDAAESIRELPEVSVRVEEVTSQHGNSGAADAIDRIDSSLYAEEKVAKKSKGAAAEEKPKKGKKSEGGYFRLVVRDNGCGIHHEDIPNMFGIVLSGTKYGIKQTRGKFGLGSKMVLIWSKMTSGLPIEIRSSRGRDKPLSYCKLGIDLKGNTPDIKVHKQGPNNDFGRGTEISVVISGNWSTYKSYVVKYMRQLAMITPYAHLELSYVGENDATSFSTTFSRRTDSMPPLPKDVKMHPASLDNMSLADLLNSGKHQTLEKALSAELFGLTLAHTRQIIDEVFRGEVSPMSNPKHLTDSQRQRLNDTMKKMSFTEPDASALSPAGEYNLRLGVVKELRPELIATFSDDAASLDGHALHVEAAVSLGGRGAEKVGLHIHRYANRIPMLFQEGSDVVTQTVKHRINWNSYKINPSSHKIGIFVSIVSTKVPFGGVNKEYITDDIPSLQESVRNSIMRCCQQLAIKIRAKQAQAQRTEKLKMFASHIVHVSRALATLQKQAFDRCQKILPVATVPCPVPSLLSITDARIAESELHSKLKSFVEQVYFSRIFIFSSSIFNLVFTIALFSLIWMPHCSSSSYRPHPRVNKKMFTSNPSPNK